MARFIGIRHRIKQTAEHEARPTQVAILEDDGELHLHDLADETAELDFMLGRFPTSYRDLTPTDDAGKFPDHQIQWKRTPKEEIPKGALTKVEGKDTFIAKKVPYGFDGLEMGDTVAMVLGGSGDYFAYALSRRAGELGGDTKVIRIPPFTLDKMRQDKEEDATNLAKLAKEQPTLFYVTEIRDRRLIRVRECLQLRTDTMKARIACEQRLRQRVIGMVFCTEEGRYPEGTIEKLFDETKANDATLVALTNEETKRESELTKALEAVEVYTRVFKPVEGMGPMIAARLISTIIDIRRFKTDAALKAYCGVHVLEDGRFPRQRGGEVANWAGDARQALYLFADQCNRRPGSTWGAKLLEYKAHFRRVHPDVICKEDGITWEACEKKKSHTRKYTDGHILKMAKWRTVTKFVEWLHAEWSKVG